MARQMLAGHIYAIRWAATGGRRAGRPAGNLVTTARNDLCNGNCGDTPARVRVLAEKTGTFYGMPMRPGAPTRWRRNEFAAVAAPGKAAGGQCRARRLYELRLDAAGNLLLAARSAAARARWRRTVPATS